MRNAFLALALAFAATSLVARPATAQDDWSVKRDPFDAGTVRRYKAILAKKPHDTAALQRLSQLYKRYRSLDKLIEEYREELKKDPKDHAVHVILARIELDRGDSAAAIAHLRAALAAQPSDATASLLLGDLHWRAGNGDQATEVYEKALTHKPSAKLEVQLTHKLAGIAASTGKVEGIVTWFRRYLELAPRDVQGWLEFGDALSTASRYDMAIEAFKNAERLLSGDPARRIEVIARLGAAYEGADDLEQAVREYRRAMGMTRRGYYIRKELTSRIVDIYRRRQELAELTKQYESEWPAGNRDHFEWDTLARLYEEVGDQEKAVAAYRRATKKAPYELDTHRRLIRLLETTGKDDEALAQYESVIRVAPGEPRFQLELAERYYRRGKRDKARGLLRRLEGRFGGDPGVHAALADLYAKYGEEDLALEAHARLARIEPSETIHLVNLGDLYFQRGDKKTAIATWKRIITRKTPENFARLGQVYSDHDMTTPALEMYGKAIKLSAKDPALYRGRAAVYEKQKDWREAVSDWQKAYDLLPDNAGGRAGKGEARRRIVALLKRSGRRALSSRMVAWQREFEAGDLDAGYFLVEAHLREGNSRGARTVLETIRKRDPADLEALQELVKVYRMEQKYEEAVALLLELAQRSPGREREIYNQVAELKTRLNQDQEAIRFAQKALEKSPTDPVAHEQLAERYLEMQQYDKAIAALEKTVELDPQNFRAYFSLARLYRNTHRLDKAADLYRRVLKRSTDDEILYKAGRAAINLEELTGTLGELESIVHPLAFTFGHREVYRRILVDLYDRYVPALVARTKSESATDRKEAVAELERLGSHGLKPLLEALADERDTTQRRIAVSVLGYLGNRGAAAPLVHLAKLDAPPSALGAPALSAELDWDLRIEALVAAGRLADPRAIPDLLELSGHSEVSMREAAIFALGMTRDRRARGALEAAIDDPRESVQALGCMGLARVGDARGTGRLVAVVTDRNRVDAVRASCAYALGVVGDAQTARALVEVLGQGNDETQRLAAWALGRLGAKSAVPALLGAYFGRRDKLREAIAWALPRAASGQMASDASLPFLDYPTRSGKFDVSRAIAELPGPLPTSAIPAELITRYEADIVAALRATLARHRDLAFRVLSELDQSPDRLSLGALTQVGAGPNDPSGPVLERIGTALIPELTELSAHADPVVRRRALSVLAKIGSPAVQATLQKALAADELEHRLAAMEAIAPLMRRGGAAAHQLGAMVAARLPSADWREQVAAATAMGTYGEGADEAALVAILGDLDAKAFVRQAAATSLGQLGSARSLPSLGRAARDPTRAVQEQAVLAIRAIGGREARKLLADIAADPNVSPSARALARSPASGKK